MYFVPKEFSPRYGPDFFTFTFVPFALDGTQVCHGHSPACYVSCSILYT